MTIPAHIDRNRLEPLMGQASPTQLLDGPLGLGILLELLVMFLAQMHSACFFISGLQACLLTRFPRIGFDGGLAATSDSAFILCHRTGNSFSLIKDFPHRIS